MDESWLQYKLTDEQVLELERTYSWGVKSDDNIKIVFGGQLPFGENYFTWRSMKAQHLAKMGEIWFYRSSESSWMQLCGREGYILLKPLSKDKMVQTGLCIQTCMS